MPVFKIPDNKIIFPHPTFANRDGLLGIGGDLSEQRLILAYQNGIFPWNNEGEPISWYCPVPRLVLYPSEIKISKSMEVLLRRNKFQFTVDQNLKEVIALCGQVNRNGQNGTWIYEELEKSFLSLHLAGFAHSIEVWKEDNLVGGLYGLALGKMFCGESMFSLVSDASKFALIVLCKILKENAFELIDCQQDTNHLRSMGADLMEAEEFFSFLENNKLHPQIKEFWKKYDQKQTLN